MKFIGNKPLYSYALTAFLVIIILATVTPSSLFVYTALTPYYLYMVLISIFIACISILLVLFRPKDTVISAPIWIAMLWGFYILIHGQFIAKTLNPFHFYLILNCAFLIALSFFIQIAGHRLSFLFKAITLIATIECLVCLCQYFGWIHSYNAYFKITGTWENPNVTAMFITMAIPMAFSLSSRLSLFSKRLAPILTILFIIVIVLLQCRTALIGSVVSLAILLNDRYSIIARLRVKKNYGVAILGIVFLLAVIVPVGNYVYQAKKTSADGRQLIWKLSAEMAAQRPVTGYGYGEFSKNYNLFQSQYFKDGYGDTQEIKTAGFVYMGYNEVLENLVEGGLLGAAFLIILFLLLLTTRQVKTETEPASSDATDFILAYAGSAAFIVMSLFNFSLEAVPAMCLFVLYASVLSSLHPVRFLSNWKGLNIAITPASGFAMAALLLVIGGIAGLWVGQSAYAEIKIKQAQVALMNNKNGEALHILQSLASTPNLFENYHTVYGDVLLKQKKYSEAMAEFSKASLYSSNPELYLKLALCSEKTGQYQLSEKDYLIAENIEPSRLIAKSSLMQLYARLKDTAKTISMAREILAVKPKIPSSQAEAYQNRAYIVLKKLSAPFPRKQSQLTQPLNLKYN